MSRALRILQLNSARKYVGEAAHTLNLSEALRQRGHTVWLGLRKNYDTFERAAARRLAPLGFHMPHRWWPPQEVPDIWRIAALVKKEKIDVIHAHRGKDHWQAVLASRMFGTRVPVIRTRHVVTPLKDHAANRWLARRTAALVAVSQAVEADVRRSGMYANAKIRFIPGGVDLSLFNPATRERRLAARTALNVPATAPAVVCVARFAVVKAHAVLLEAWKAVVEKIPAATLLLVGAGAKFDECKARARAMGLERNVAFLGKRMDVPNVLDAADVGVLSSVGSEGFSRAVLEYMAAALPTVGTRVGAVPDLIEENVHGRLVAPNDAAALARGLLDVLGAPVQQRAAWGRAAYEKAELNYSYASWAAAHEMLYEELIPPTA
jgi:glycosyltransferase involved in cell wall biosynthesis